MDFFARRFLPFATEYLAIRSASREMSFSSASPAPLPGGWVPSMYSRSAWLIWVWYGGFPRLTARALKNFRMSLSMKMVMRTLVCRSSWSRGGTFTITNIGALGGTGAIPIINYPEAAILAVARGREEPVVRGGQVVVRMMLPITLTFDHRVADGADGARFAQAIIRRLEAPETLFVGW